MDIRIAYRIVLMDNMIGWDCTIEIFKHKQRTLTEYSDSCVSIARCPMFRTIRMSICSIAGESVESSNSAQNVRRVHADHPSIHIRPFVRR